MRIALPISTFLPTVGGAEIGLHTIATELAAEGHQPVVVAPWSHWRQLRSQGWELPYKVIPMPPRVQMVSRIAPNIGSSLLACFFGALQKRLKFDVWHVNIAFPAGVAAAKFKASQPQVPVLIQCPGEDIQILPEISYGVRLNPDIDRLIRRWIPVADRLIALTDSVASEYRDLAAPEYKIVNLPYAIDLGRFNLHLPGQAAIRAELGISDDEFLFLCTGRNHPKKDFPTLVRAAAVLRSRTKKRFAVLFVGGGSAVLATMGRELGLGRIIRAHPAVGPLPDEARGQTPSNRLLQIMRASDAFVFPSRIETFGIVLAEAMACGLPIIATDAPGCRDVVRPNFDGISVRPGDHEALAAAMQQVLDDPTLCEDMKRKSLTRAEDFGKEEVVRKLVDLYEQCIVARIEAKHTS